MYNNGMICKKAHFSCRFCMEETDDMKKIALINDISSLGRCSLTVSLPIVSVLGLQACPIPSAVLTAQTGFEGFSMFEFPQLIADAIGHFSSLDISFEGILTGFMPSASVMKSAERFIKSFREGKDGKKAFVLVDPVMADGGKLYSSYTKEMCDGVKGLVRLANAVTPNLSEACLLSGEYYNEVAAITDKERLKSKIHGICVKISSCGPHIVAVTGCERGEYIHTFLYNAEDESFFETVSCKYGVGYSGTGDIFASLLFSSIVKGVSAEKSLKLACEFIGRASKSAFESGTARNYGTDFERCLPWLAEEFFRICGEKEQ